MTFVVGRRVDMKSNSYLAEALRLRRWKTYCAHNFLDDQLVEKSCYRLVLRMNRPEPSAFARVEGIAMNHQK